ncbi:hypothetical protein EEB14_16860 [Rhodococcus sp. WS4]|nr:hypothetical protein EEB14_16860 [Rhodococcus sp. WS4]
MTFIVLRFLFSVIAFRMAGCDLGREAGDRFLDESTGHSGPICLPEESVDAQHFVGEDDLLDRLVGAADHDGVPRAGAGGEACLVYWKPRPPGGLSRRHSR